MKFGHRACAAAVSAVVLFGFGISMAGAENQGASGGISMYKDPAKSLLRQILCGSSIAERVLLKSGQYRLVWSDEFESGAVDETVWSFEEGYKRNNELQYYTKDNAWMEDGCLVLEARKESKFPGFAYTSASLTTRHKKSFHQGVVAVRAKLPRGQGLLPAFWTMGDQNYWPSGGEIDVFEMVGGAGRENTCHGTIHWGEYQGTSYSESGKTTLLSGTLSDEFHVYAAEWTDTEIIWFLDGQEYYRTQLTEENKKYFTEPHRVLLSLAVGGDWPGAPDETTVFPQRYVIDWVRVYQK